MKIEMTICNIQEDGIRSRPWTEEESPNTSDPEAWAKETLEHFNNTFHPGQLKRELISVKVLDVYSVSEHDWRKINLVTQDTREGIFDTYKCEVCGITAKRFGLGDSFTRDKKYKAKVYSRCYTAYKKLKGEDMADAANRKVMLGLLDKMKLEYTSKISNERAQKKIARNLKKKGLPEGMTKAEEWLVKELGFEILESNIIPISAAKEKKTEEPKEEAPAPEVKKEKKKTTPKKEKPPKAKKEAPARRVDFISETISDIPQKGIPIKDISVRANEAFVRAGGSDNLKQTLHQTRVLLPAAIVWGVVKMKDGLVVPI